MRAALEEQSRLHTLGSHSGILARGGYRRDIFQPQVSRTMHRRLAPSEERLPVLPSASGVHGEWNLIASRPGPRCAAYSSAHASTTSSTGVRYPVILQCVLNILSDAGAVAK
jgi:hypothetical protein